jgi:catechol 2,3-dioxygenase-like lactoylglutathione lyase family enzyme
MEYSIDHAVLFVENLDAATAEFTELGFLVTPGGTHTGGLTENALILLADGTYLELLGFTVPLERLTGGEERTALDRRFVPRGRVGQGFGDFACGIAGLEGAIAAARGAGLEVEGPFPGGRTRPDGIAVEWQLAFPADDVLPFLIEDVTDRALRVPRGDATRHANGASGIVELVVRTDDTKRIVNSYEKLFGSAAEVSEGAVSFHLTNGVITIQPGTANSVRLHTSVEGATGAFECHGVRIELAGGTGNVPYL